MEPSRPQLIILADPPDALCILFGISLLERLLRLFQRIGFLDAIILSSSTKQIAAHLAEPSWARADVTLTLRARNVDGVLIHEVKAGPDRVLVVSAGYYYDARLLEKLTGQNRTTLLVDSEPPQDCVCLWLKGRDPAGPSPVVGPSANPSEFSVAAALLDPDWLSQQNPDALLLNRLSTEVANGRIETYDASREPTYVTALRKHVRPVFFPAPSSNLIALASQFPRDVAQNGVLDFPGFLDSPLEDWIVARLCRTSIRPNQVTFATMLIGLTVTLLFATGHLWWGAAFAYAIEVLDGVDGKLARTKVETTATGEWEHLIDYGVELSWWIALAFHFRGNNLSSAYWLLCLLIGSDLIDRLAKRVVKKRVGRNLDDVSNFDRFVRCIGSRRNINIWILIAALALGDAVHGFVLVSWWTAATAMAHVIRAFQIWFGKPWSGAN